MPVLHDFWVDKIPVDHILDRALLQLVVAEIDDSVADEEALEVDLGLGGSAGVEVEVVDAEGQVRDVLAGVGLACDPEVGLLVLGVEGEEVLEGVEVVVHGGHVVVLERRVLVC